MPARPHVAFFGSSLVSAYWNGAATYYRGIVKALHAHGVDVTFYEPDAYDRQAHRDIDPPSWARSVVYPATASGLADTLHDARGATVVVKTSGVGVFDAELEQGVLDIAPGRAVFWDVDAPATLGRVGANPKDPFRALIPKYSVVLTYGGGPAVVEAYKALGARDCVPVYNALDPETHHPVPPDQRFAGALSLQANRLPDREARIEEFFLKAAHALVPRPCVLGGNGWSGSPLPPNVNYVGHVFTADHNAFNCSALAVLNVNREDMARVGFSPPTRVFEAAGAGACLITDAWKGIDAFLEPGREILVAASGDEVAAHVDSLTPERARRIGIAARRRVLAEHTYDHRVQLVLRVLDLVAVSGSGQGSIR